jgi:hypothetical protein
MQQPHDLGVGRQRLADGGLDLVGTLQSVPQSSRVVIAFALFCVERSRYLSAASNHARDHVMVQRLL